MLPGMTDPDVASLVAHVGRQLPEAWPTWPGGWPDEIEAALIDAVLSIRANYGSVDNGVRGAVRRWREHRAVERLDDLSALASIGPEELARVLDNRQVLSGGTSKASGIREAATRLVQAGVRHAAQLDPQSPEHRTAYTGVRGLSNVTYEYLLMLLHHPGVKWTASFPPDSRPTTVCFGK
jgi:hypothetical protein